MIINPFQPEKVIVQTEREVIPALVLSINRTDKTAYMAVQRDKQEEAIFKVPLPTDKIPHQNGFIKELRIGDTVELTLLTHKSESSFRVKKVLRLGPPKEIKDMETLKSIPFHLFYTMLDEDRAKYEVIGKTVNNNTYYIILKLNEQK